MNPFTGEIDFTYQDKNYILRPSFGAIAEIEQELGKSIMWLLENIETRGLLLKEQELIFNYGLKYADFNLTKIELNGILQQLGIIKTTEICMRFLHNIFN